MTGFDDLPLFILPPGIVEEPPGPVAGEIALQQTASRAKNAAMIERLVPVARRLAEASYPEGVTVTDLRKQAVGLGLLTGFEKGHELSYLGAVMRRAGLRGEGTRRSSITQTHGKIQIVWYFQ